MSQTLTSQLPIADSLVGRAHLVAARIAIAAGLLFAALLGLLHLVEPEYDPTWRFVSEYALGRFGWMMTLAFAALGVSLASAAVVARSHIRGWLGAVGLFIIAVAVVGLLIAAMFETDPMIGGRGTATFSGQMHVLGASLDFTPLGALLVSFSLARNPAWRGVRSALFITALITIVLTAAFMALLPSDYQFGPGVYAGLMGRFLLLSYLGWIFTVAGHALRLEPKQTSRARHVQIEGRTTP